jgi:hypothetical protein
LSTETSPVTSADTQLELTAGNNTEAVVVFLDMLVVYQPLSNDSVA